MAISGMTGFARQEGALGAWTWAIEARSVNGRNLETRFRGPPGFDSLERLAREASQARFQRGQVNVGVTAKRTDSSADVRVNLEQLERYLALGASLMAEGKASPPTLDGLLALKGVIEAADDSDDPAARTDVEAALAASLALALDNLKVARQEEGAALLPVLNGILGRIEGFVADAEAEAAAQPAQVKERFERRLAELMAGHSVDPDRVVQEAATLAAKSDVREELDRLMTHIEAARTLLGSEQAAGRRLDFLSQEFMREANTLCSKAATKRLTAIGLDLKAAIEQLREQVQNVE